MGNEKQIGGNLDTGSQQNESGKSPMVQEIDLSKLSIEQKQEYEELQKKFEATRLGQIIVKKRETNLMDKLLERGDPKDKEYAEVVERIKKLQSELKSLGEETQSVQKSLSLLLADVQNEINKISPEETNALKNISNRKFLDIPMSQRLQYINKDGIGSSEVANGNVKNLEFTFTFDGSFNKELYLKTTAGQVLPKEVSRVIVNGTEFIRVNNSSVGEFYDAGNNRLEIHENTKLEVSQLRTPQELENMEKGLAEALKGKEKPIERMIAEVAYEKGVSEKLLSALAKEHLDIAGLELWDYDEQDKIEIQKLLENEQYIKAELETYATEISRLLSGTKNLEKDNYSIELLADIFKEKNPAGWKNKLVQYGFSAQDVQQYSENNYNIEPLGLGSLSAKEESGNRGPEAINLNDSKGPAYGTYQLCQDALVQFAKGLSINGTPGTSEFTSNWINKITELGRGAFQKLEHDFIKKTHFDVQVGKIQQSTGLDISKATLSLQNVIWSTAVQHGPNTSIIVTAIRELGITDISSLNNQEKLITQIYQERKGAYPQLQDRYKRELNAALSFLNKSLEGEINIGNFVPSAAERSEKGTTLCSKTAYLNLKNLGINAKRGDSAKTSFQQYDPSQITKTFSPDAKVADLFLDASPKNREYGHRAVAINSGGAWFVFDPYLPVGGQMPSTRPIPLQEYMNYIESRGKKFWGAVMYT